ncbi:MAG: GTP 3',8-cyclase MoaA [Chloroflexi bacterium]|nr:MAG: GTP 3',8-cyclase MoaA [Chloroflexota bacterium]
MTSSNASTEGNGPLTITDRLGRPLRDLRISVTDRCNFRCRYCMPREVFGADFAFLPRSEILSFEEITRLARIFADHGVQKIRLTGGEPTLRAELPTLIQMLKETIPGIEIAMTTNASLLVQQAEKLAKAGLDRITVSLDSLDDDVFRAMNDVNFPVARVLEGIEAAQAAGIGPIKVNAVVKRGVNDHTIVPLAKFIRERGLILRYIEYMDVGTKNGWRMDDVVPGSEVVEMISKELPLEPMDAQYRGEVAKRWRYADGSGEVGVITSVTAPFCGDCTRARLSAEGSIYTCLFAAAGTDFRALLRNGSSDEEIGLVIREMWGMRDDRYSEIRSDNTVHMPKVEMSYIGG